MKRNLLITFLISFPLLISACSSSEVDEFGEDEEGAIYEEFEEESGADEVGSVPEDDAELLNEFAEGGEGDPFSDLQEEDQPQEIEEADSDGGGSDGSMASYTIMRGDTLMKIAFDLYGDVERWRDLLNWNRDSIGSVHALRPGTTIRYSSLGTWSQPKLPYSYNIQQGDTLGAIARQIYGDVMKYKKLQRYNSRLIKDPNLIYAGFDLYYDLTPEEQSRGSGMRLGDSSTLPDATKSIATEDMEEDEMAEPIATAMPDAESSTQ